MEQDQDRAYASLGVSRQDGPTQEEIEYPHITLDEAATAMRGFAKEEGVLRVNLWVYAKATDTWHQHTRSLLGATIEQAQGWLCSVCEDLAA